MFEDLETIDDNFTLSYSFDEKGWIAFHDYTPDYIFTLRNNDLYSYFNGSIFKHHANNYGVYYGILGKAIIQPTFYPPVENQASFILNSINWVTDTKSLKTTFNAIQVYNSFQETELIDIKIYDDDCSLREQFGNFNTRRNNNSWYFNDIKVDRDNCKLRKQPFVDDYVIVKLIFDNESSLIFHSINFNVNIVR